METLDKILLTYSQVIQRQKQSPLRRTEVPVEHERSMPVPTLRYGKPAFAFFACPCVRAPGKPLEVEPPDRWWVLDAHGGKTLVYALAGPFPFAADEVWKRVVVQSRAGVGVNELLKAMKEWEARMDGVSAAFFAGEPCTAETSQALEPMASLVIPGEMRPWYEALAPDFFAWLAGKSLAPV